MGLEVEEESKFGKTLLSIKDIGLKTKQMEEGDLYMEMEMSTKENGKMIKPTAKEFIQK